MTVTLSRPARSAVLAAVVSLAAALGAAAQDGAAGGPPVVRAGGADAPMQFTLFCSIESEPCARLVVLLGRLLHERPQGVAVTFRHVAPPEQERSPLVYRVVLAAARQGKGWQALDTYYMNVAALEAVRVEGLPTVLGLDAAAFAADLADGSLAGVLEEDAVEAARLSVTATPALFLNGRRLESLWTYEAIVAALR